MIKRLLLILIILQASFASYAGTIKILNIEAKKIDRYVEVIVYTSENIKPEIIQLESPNRIALAFPGSKIDSPITIPGPSSMIRIIQALQFDENTVYVMVEPNEKLTYDYASIIGRNKYILELTHARPESAKIVAPSPAEKISEVSLPITPEAIITTTTEVAPPPFVEKIIVTPEVTVISAEVEISAEAVKPITKVTKIPVKKPPKVEISKIVPALEGKVIVIDPGHGGRDPGYVGKSGILEKFLTLKIAVKLKKILSDAGAKVILTREKDMSTKDKEIVGVANGNNADLFVAIHFNSYIRPSAGGCETYYFNPGSKTFAKVMQRNVCRAVKRRNRGIKKVTYYTIHHTKMPAVLVEPIYLTNYKEERLILSPQFQGSVAYGMYKGITEYAKMMTNGRNIPDKTGKAYNIRQGNAKSTGNIRKDHAN